MLAVLAAVLVLPAVGGARMLVRPVVAPTLDEITPFLVPGASARLSAEVPHPAVCGLMFIGPHKLRSGPFKVRSRQPHILFSWKLPRKVAPGIWTARLACGGRAERKRTPTVGALTAHLQVSGNYKSYGRGLSIVQPGSLRIGFSHTAPAIPDGGTQYRSGRGSGGFNSCQCTGYAYSRRPDIYNYTASKGFGGGDWDGGYWGDRAAEAGEVTGDLPVVGALVSFKPGVYGTPPPAGHVGYVESVAPDGQHFTMSSKDGLKCNEIVYWKYNVLALGRANGMTFIYGPPGSTTPSSGAGTPPTSTGTPPIGPGTTPGVNGTEFVYFVGNDGNLRVSHWTGSIWQTDDFQQGVESGTSPSAYLGPNGTHFVYFVGNDGSLRVSHWTGSIWQTDDFQQGVLSGTSPSAYLGPNGTHFVYFVGNDGSLRVSRWTGSIWQMDNFSQGVESGTSPSAYLGANGTHFVYFVGNDGSLRVSHWTGSIWQMDNFSQGVLSGTSPSAYLG